MPIYISGSPKDFTPAPEGLHQAVCVDVVDLGEVEDQWGAKRRVELYWQIEEVNPETGKRFVIRRRCTASLNEKATLRQILEAWRGRKFTKDELERFDLETVLGANCQVQIVHNIAEDGRIFGNVQAVVPAAKNVPKLRPLDYVRKKDREKDQKNGKEEADGGEESAPF